MIFLITSKIILSLAYFFSWKLFELFHRKLRKWKLVFYCLYVWNFSSHLRNLSLIWRLHLCRLRAANFDLCSALITIEQWGFLSMPHLLWNGASFYNGHLHGPVTLTPIVKYLAVKLSLPVIRLRSVEHPTFLLRSEHSNQLCNLFFKISF